MKSRIISIDDKINIRYLYRYTTLSFDGIHSIYYINKYNRRSIRNYLNQIKIEKGDEFKSLIKKLIKDKTNETTYYYRLNQCNLINSKSDKIIDLFIRGFSVWEIKSIIDRELNKNFRKLRYMNILKENLGVDEYLLRSKLNRAMKLKREINFIGTLITVTDGIHIKILRSFPEFIFFLYLYIIKMHNFDDIIYEKYYDTPEGGRKTDFLVNNINYEIHTKGYESDKINFFKYLETKGIKSIYITTKECYTKYWSVIEKFGIDLKSIFKESRRLNKEYKYLIFNVNTMKY